MIQKKTAWQTKFIEPCMFVCVGNFNQQIRPPTGKKIWKGNSQWINKLMNDYEWKQKNINDNVDYYEIFILKNKFKQGNWLSLQPTKKNLGHKHKILNKNLISDKNSNEFWFKIWLPSFDLVCINTNCWWWQQPGSS